MTIYYISKDKNPTDPVSDNANIIPFPVQPAPRKHTATSATGPRLISLTLRRILHRTRERVLKHLRMTRKSANDQGNGKFSKPAPAAVRKTA